MDKELIMCIAMYVIIFLWIFICPVVVSGGEEKRKRSRTMANKMEQLNGEFIKMCNNRDCDCCKYNIDIPCHLQFGYEKGRADAIDECIKLVGGNTKTIVGIVFDNSIPIHDRALGRMAKNKLIEELVEQLEQLKEQK